MQRQFIDLYQCFSLNSTIALITLPIFDNEFIHVVCFCRFSSGSNYSLKRTLDVFRLYCNEWKLSVNISKSKIMIFSKRKTIRNKLFKKQKITINRTSN